MIAGNCLGGELHYSDTMLRFLRVVIPSDFSFKRYSMYSRWKVYPKTLLVSSDKKIERDNEVEIRCSMSITKYDECEWDELWSLKWMRWKWMTKWMSWTLVYEMNDVNFGIWNVFFIMQSCWLGRNK